jgi:hypothetical protein
MMLFRKQKHKRVRSVFNIRAFRLQGTNAHAVLQSSQHGTGGASSSKPAAAWMQQRFWVAPPVHAALLRATAAPGGRLISMQALLTVAPLAYTWDHQVGGKALFPGAGFFELAAAAAKIAGAASSAAFLGVSIPAPLVLPPLALERGKPHPPLPALVCKLDASSGAVEASSGQHSVHLRSRVSAVALIDAAGRHAGGRPAAARAPVSLWPAVRPHVKPALAGEPAYTAGIVDAEQQARDVFLSPAVMDCCLHLGALPAAAARQLKVPAGIDALVLPGLADNSRGAEFAAAARQVQTSPAASVIDYALLASDEAAACTISGLLAKPLHAQLQPAAATQAVQGAPRMLYEIQWTATAPAPLALSSTPAGALAPVMPAGNAAALCSTSLAAFQAAVAEQRNGLSVQTAGAQPQLSVLSLAGQTSSKKASSSLLWGMLRSVALEHTSAAVSAIDADLLAAHAPPPAAVLHLAASAAPLRAASHAYGQATRSGLSYSAVLLPSTSPPGSAVRPSGQLAAMKARRGHVAVTGGMGSLGSLLAGWLEDARLASALLLIGRTGRQASSGGSASLAALLAGSQAAVGLVMADMATAEVSHAVLGAAGGATAALAALFHSGGVLADATLAKQTPSGIRAVFAAKVAAAQRWRQTLLSQPTAGQVLFSSVAALLGSGGQANYSAANAWLDASASFQQEQACGAARSAACISAAASPVAICLIRLVCLSRFWFRCFL